MRRGVRKRVGWSGGGRAGARLSSVILGQGPAFGRAAVGLDRCAHHLRCTIGAFGELLDAVLLDGLQHDLGQGADDRVGLPGGCITFGLLRQIGDQVRELAMHLAARLQALGADRQHIDESVRISSGLAARWPK